MAAKRLQASQTLLGTVRDRDGCNVKAADLSHNLGADIVDHDVMNGARIEAGVAVLPTIRARDRCQRRWTRSPCAIYGKT